MFCSKNRGLLHGNSPTDTPTDIGAQKKILTGELPSGQRRSRPRDGGV
jgi:hypothetical protein